MDTSNFLDSSLILNANSREYVAASRDSKKATIRILAPWWVYYRKLKALFHKDSEINIIFDSENFINNIFVDNPDKADALKNFIPEKVMIGSTTIRNKIIPSNRAVTPVEGIPAQRAFAGNEAVVDIHYFESEFMSNSMTFITFKNEVVQYYTDNASSLDGVSSDLYENLALEIFDAKGHLYSTEKGNDVVQMEQAEKNALDQWIVH